MTVPTYRRIKGSPLTNDQVDDNFLNLYTEKADLASPALTGTPTAPTAAVGINTTQIATTAYVKSQGYATLASPALTGTPSAPTALADTNSTQLATTAFVVGQASSASPLMNGAVATGVSLKFSREDHKHPSDTTKANLASPAFTGTPTADTAAVDTSTTQLATTAFVVGQGYAKLASPTLTGTPNAPTAAVNTNTQQIATTAYVMNQGYAKLASPTFTGTVTAPTFAGALTGNASGTASNITGVAAIANGGTGATTAAAALTALGAQAALGFTPYNSSNPAAYIASGAGSFAPGGLCEVGRYLDFHGTDNVYDYDVRFDATKGAAAGGGALTISASNGMTCTGDITAFSDERLKTDWADLSDTFVEQLAVVKSGTYERIDGSGTRQVGVSAQSLEALMPEAIHTHEDGILSVAYGNAALAACVALAKRVVALESKLAELGVK